MGSRTLNCSGRVPLEVEQREGCKKAGRILPGMRNLGMLARRGVLCIDPRHIESPERGTDALYGGYRECLFLKV